jgi:hypothetical protein
MKVTIDVDLSPEEARRLMGLPDLEPMQQRLLEQLEKQLSGNLAYMDPEMLVKAVLPMGAQGLEQFQNLLWGLAKSATSGKKGSTKKSD